MKSAWIKSAKIKHFKWKKSISKKKKKTHNIILSLKYDRQCDLFSESDKKIIKVQEENRWQLKGYKVQ